MREACWSETEAHGVISDAGRRAVDPVGIAAAIVDHGLRLLKMDATAAQRIGLDGLHICAGHPFAQQLWIAGTNGVHAIEILADPPLDPLTPPGALRADLLVRFYPRPGTPAFTALTPDERAVRQDPGFDDTGAPDRELTRALYETPLFAIGLLRLALDPHGQAMAVQGLSGTAEGWAALHPLHDLMVTMLAFVHRVAPLSVVAVAPTADSGETGQGRHVVLPCGDGLRRVMAAGGPAVGPAAFVTAARQGGEGVPPQATPARWWTAGTWTIVPEAAPCACHAAEGGHAHHHHYDHAAAGGAA